MRPDARQRLLQACEKAGADARLHGFARDDNPYAASAPRAVSLVVASDRLLLAEAWWRGWDRADADAPHAPPPRRPVAKVARARIAARDLDGRRPASATAHRKP
jgi:hypothetical protein